MSPETRITPQFEQDPYALVFSRWPPVMYDGLHCHQSAASSLHIDRMSLNPADLFSGSDKLIEANNLNGMAAVYEKRNDLDDAARLYEEALAIYEEIFGVEHFTTALVIRNLARVLRARGDTAEASLLEDQATDILSRRRESNETKKSQFGGSSGFFELMGEAYTRHMLVPAEEQPESEQSITEGQSGQLEQQ